MSTNWFKKFGKGILVLKMKREVIANGELKTLVESVNGTPIQLLAD